MAGWLAGWLSAINDLFLLRSSSLLRFRVRFLLVSSRVAAVFL